MTYPGQTFLPVEEFHLSAGEKDWTILRTILFSGDVSGDTVQMGVGDEVGPDTTTWQSAGSDFILTRPSTTSIGVQLFIGGAVNPTSPSEYFTYVKLTVGAVVNFIRLARIVVS